MRRLVLADLAAGWRLWIGLFLVLWFGAAITLGAATELSVAQALPGDEGVLPDVRSGLVNSAIIYLTVSGTVVATATLVISRYLVRLKARVFALWQIAGVQPRQIARVLLAQISIVFVAAALAGGALAPAVADLNVNYIARTVSATGKDWPDPLPLTVDPAVLLVALVAFFGVVVLCSLAALRRASRVEILDLLRTPDAGPRRRGRIIRSILLVLFLAAAVAVRILSVIAASGNLAALASLLALVGYLVAAPTVAGWIMTAWTALVPVRSSAWFLARSSTRYFVDRSSAIITFVVVPASVFSLLVALGSFGNGTDKLSNIRFGLLLFGPSVLAALAFAGIALFMSAPDRSIERAMIQVVGSTPRTSLAAAALEALVYAVTGAVIAALVVAAGASDLLLAAPWILSLAGAAYLLMLGVLAGPVLLGRRRSEVGVLVGRA